MGFVATSQFALAVLLTSCRKRWNVATSIDEYTVLSRMVKTGPFVRLTSTRGQLVGRSSRCSHSASGGRAGSADAECHGPASRP